MRTKEIPRKDWPGFFETFSRTHEGWRVTLEALGADMGDQVEAEAMPLGEITAESEPGGRCVVNVILGGGDAPSPITRTIDDAKRVWVEQGEDGVDRALQIEEADGVKTILRLEKAGAARQLAEAAAKH